MRKLLKIQFYRLVSSGGFFRVNVSNLQFVWNQIYITKIWHHLLLCSFTFLVFGVFLLRLLYSVYILVKSLYGVLSRCAKNWAVWNYLVFSFLLRLLNVKFLVLGSKNWSQFSIVSKSILEYIFLIGIHSLHARLNSHYEAWSYTKKKHKKVKAYMKSL